MHSIEEPLLCSVEQYSLVCAVGKNPHVCAVEKDPPRFPGGVKFPRVVGGGICTYCVLMGEEFPCVPHG